MKKIRKIKSGILERQLGMAKLALKTGTDYLFSNKKELRSKLQAGLENNVEEIVKELGVMKGSFMKAGQMLSVYAGSFLPPSAQKVLSSLEAQTSYLEWEQIQERIPPSWHEEIDINHTPVAAASLGQVHLATINQKKYAMKVQYKGVKKAIKNDVKMLKVFLYAFKLIPKELKLDEIFVEIEQMLQRETNYKEEAQTTDLFASKLKKYPQYKVPQVLHKYSTESIITTEFLEGYTLHEIDSLNMTQEQKNKLGEDFMRLLLIEIFELKKIQTDVHFGNFLILREKNQFKWGLIDFGASKTPPDEFIYPYQNLIIALANKDKELFLSILYEMGYLSQDKKTNHDFFWEYVETIGAPLQAGIYDWGTSNIAEKVLEYAPRLLKEVSIGSPPHHTVFIDKKISGVFFVLQKLGAQIDSRKILLEFIKKGDK